MTTQKHQEQTELDEKQEKIGAPFISPWWGLYVILVIGYPLFSLLTFHPEPDNFGIVYPFTLQTQDDVAFQLGEDDRPVIVNFIFTRCTTICPVLTGKMAELQDRIDPDDALFLSISVDPEHDSPQILQEFGKRFDADFSRWFFLTGSKNIVTNVVASFQQTFERIEGSDTEINIMHSEKFILLDHFGHIRGFYDDDPEGLNRLLLDLRAL